MLILAFEQAARKDWQEHTEPPKKPSNWKQETYEAKLPELWVKKEEGAAQDLAAGEITKVAVRVHVPVQRDDDQLQLFEGGYPFVRWAVNDNSVGTSDDVDTWLIGINLLDSLRQCGWDSAQARAAGNTPPSSIGAGDVLGTNRSERWLWNLPSFLGTVTLFDPYSLSGAKSAGISIERWLGEWGLSWPSSAEERLANVAAAAKLIGIYA
jgi:hypothetical protein